MRLISIWYLSLAYVKGGTKPSNNIRHSRLVRRTYIAEVWCCETHFKLKINCNILVKYIFELALLIIKLGKPALAKVFCKIGEN